MQATAAPTPLAAAELPDDVDRSDAVAVAYVYDQDVTYAWHHSMIELLGWDMARHGRVMRGGYVAMHYGTDGLVQARNLGVKTFLEEREADWLMWLDTDMGFPPNAVDQLMAVADPVERPVVGGLTFAQRETGADGLGGWLVQPQPVVMDQAQVGQQSGFVPRLDYSRDTVTQVAGTGSACILIHRSAFERVQAQYGMCWYSRIPNHSTGEMVSEDLSFCMRLSACKVPIFVHTGVKTSHQKTIWVDERVYDRMPPPPFDAPAGLVVWPGSALKKADAPPSDEPAPAADEPADEAVAADV